MSQGYSLGSRVISAQERDDRDHEHIRLLLAFLLRTDSCCIDVGAYKGLVLNEMVRLAPDGRHIAYEPLAEHAADLRARFPSVDVRACAAGAASAETALFYRVAADPALSGLHPRDKHAETTAVPVEALDDGLPAAFRPAVIKIDVEGAEELVLAGAESTLARHRPVVILEHGAGASHYGTRTTTIFSLLSAAGLRVFDIDGGGPYDADGMERIVARDTLWTWVAHP